MRMKTSYSWHRFGFSHYVLLALFFSGGLELVFALQRYFLPLIGLVLLAVVVGIFVIRSEEGGGFHPTQTILPSMAALALSAFALFLPATAIIHLYVGMSGVVFFYVLKYGARKAYPTWNFFITFLVTFLLLVAILGWRFLLYAPPWMVLLAAGVTFFLLSFQLLLRFYTRLIDAIFLALILAFGLLQVTWVLHFFPLHYMVQAAIVVTLYYGIVQLLVAYVEKRLSRREIWQQVLISGSVLTILLLTSQWT